TVLPSLEVIAAPDIRLFDIKDFKKCKHRREYSLSLDYN
ncbi:hypothetical protein CLAFUW4_06735, partial [Fulvia fulva]